MKTFLSTVILLAGLTQASNGTAGQPGYQPSPSQNITSRSFPTSPVQIRLETTAADAVSRLGERLLPEQARQTVLVVPTPDLPAESRVQLAEDMTVMCRIFDKALLPSRVSVGISDGDRTRFLRYFTNEVDQQTAQGLYLDGYGALFFINIDYPLVPPEQEGQAQPEPQAPTDSVWAQTIAEMTGQPSDEDRTAPTYDPQKVENLKRTLTKTLAHAANIRMRQPRDLITLVVGALEKDNAASYSFYTMSTAGRGVSVTPSGRRRTGWRSPITSSARRAHAGLMIMHVAKADVDAFAKGQLTLAQFTDKVQTLWSWPNWGPPRDDQGTVPTPGVESAPSAESVPQQR